MPTVIDNHHHINSKVSGQKPEEHNYLDHFSHAYHVNRFEKKTKLGSVSDIYRIFIDNWSESVMEWVMAYKVLLFDKNEKTIADIYFEPVSGLNLDHVSMLFKIISEIPDADSIIIGRNHASREFKPDLREKAFATIFNQCAKKINVRVKDQYVISSLGMYKFKKDDYLKAKEIDAYLLKV